jgi:tetratricopeptide (TPR) repeat protein
LNGNYGGFLLGMGRKEEANPYVEKAFQLISKIPYKELELELWFYKLAHYPEHYEEAKTNIDRLLSENSRSIGWDFSKNIEQAEQEGHLHLDELKDYAHKITSE